ncbi:MAG: 3-oxo-5-alpha-steroid 4-dehydrogenase [Acidobacteriota bacterium]|nr:3-oxo-5-alpha-steroid 4-dehydrogenase [Acidobacteriota bacterium]
MSFNLSPFDAMVVVWAALAIPVFIYSLVGTDHVGRTGANPRGPRVAARWGWVVMELPALCVLPAVYLSAGNRYLVADLLVAAWVIHYAHRTLLWPWIVPRYSWPMPVATCVSGFVFNVINGLLIGWFLGYAADYPREWLLDDRFIVGAAAFLTGAALNVTSDYRLAWMRHQQNGRYVIPQGGAFRLLSSPNLAGEMVEWIGFALMAWSLPALAFALWIAANLIPRALWRHRWYRRTFPDYPESRRAVIPGVL